MQLRLLGSCLLLACLASACGSERSEPQTSPTPALPDSGTSASPVVATPSSMDAATPPLPVADTGANVVTDAGTASLADASPANAAADAGMTASDASALPDGNLVDASVVGEVSAAATVAIASPPAPKGCIDRVGPADKLVFESCGESVIFDVSVPATCMSKACGLIFDVHGWTMSGPIQEQNTGLAALGRQEGYIVVQPSAPGASWVAETHDRVVSDFLKLAIEVWRVETRRVHFTGFSQGGAMTYRMRCALADTLASVAPVSMRGAACPAGTKALDTLYIMGKDDVFVTAEEAAMTVSSLLTTHGLSKDVVISMGDRHTFTRYKNAMGMVFEHLDHSYTSFPLGGHCFPGGLDAPGLYGCDEPAPFQHGRIVMDFFKAHPKRD